MDQVPPSSNDANQSLSPSTPLPAAPVSDAQKRMLEDVRLSIRDIAMVVAELQFGIDDAIAIASGKPVASVTSSVTQTPHVAASTPPQPSTIQPAIAEPVVTSAALDNSREQEEIKEALSDMSLSVPPIQTPVEEKKAMPDEQAAEASSHPQIDLNVLTEGVNPPVQTPSQPEPATPVEPVVPVSTLSISEPVTPSAASVEGTNVDYTGVLTVLSEAGVSLLRGVIEEARKKQELPAGDITDKDMIDFLLDEANNEYLKDFGDLTPIRAVIKEKLAATTNP